MMKQKKGKTMGLIAAALLPLTGFGAGFRLVQEKIRSCNADDCVGGGRK